MLHCKPVSDPDGVDSENIPKLPPLFRRLGDAPVMICIQTSTWSPSLHKRDLFIGQAVQRIHRLVDLLVGRNDLPLQ